MTDLPTWATEKAREISADHFDLRTARGKRAVDAIETALHHAYQQGKQDGQRESAKAADEIAMRDYSASYRCGASDVAAAIRALGGPDAG